MTIDLGERAGAEQGSRDEVLDAAARIGGAALSELDRWRREGMRDEAVTAISTVAMRLKDRGTDGPEFRTDVYVLTALLLLNSDASSGALATDLVELLT